MQLTEIEQTPHLLTVFSERDSFDVLGVPIPVARLLVPRPESAA